jgi:hypothetical protein
MRPKDPAICLGLDGRAVQILGKERISMMFRRATGSDDPVKMTFGESRPARVISWSFIGEFRVDSVVLWPAIAPLSAAATSFVALDPKSTHPRPAGAVEK